MAETMNTFLAQQFLRAACVRTRMSRSSGLRFEYTRAASYVQKMSERLKVTIGGGNACDRVKPPRHSSPLRNMCCICWAHLHSVRLWDGGEAAAVVLPQSSNHGIVTPASVRWVFMTVVCYIVLGLFRNINYVERQYCANWSLEWQWMVNGARTLVWYSWVSHIKMYGQLFTPAAVDDNWGIDVDTLVVEELHDCKWQDNCDRDQQSQGKSKLIYIQGYESTHKTLLYMLLCSDFDVLHHLGRT